MKKFSNLFKETKLSDTIKDDILFLEGDNKSYQKGKNASIKDNQVCLFDPNLGDKNITALVIDDYIKVFDKIGNDFIHNEIDTNKAYNNINFVFNNFLRYCGSIFINNCKILFTKYIKLISSELDQKIKEEDLVNYDETISYARYNLDDIIYKFMINNNLDFCIKPYTINTNYLIHTNSKDFINKIINDNIQNQYLIVNQLISYIHNSIVISYINSISDYASSEPKSTSYQIILNMMINETINKYLNDINIDITDVHNNILLTIHLFIMDEIIPLIDMIKDNKK